MPVKQFLLKNCEEDLENKKHFEAQYRKSREEVDNKTQNHLKETGSLKDEIKKLNSELKFLWHFSKDAKKEIANVRSEKNKLQLILKKEENDKKHLKAQLGKSREEVEEKKSLTSTLEKKVEEASKKLAAQEKFNQFTFEDAKEKKKDSDSQLQKLREWIITLEKEIEERRKQLNLQGIYTNICICLFS